MRVRLILIIMALAMTQCSTVYFYQFFGDRGSFFSEKEKGVLIKTTKALGFGYGYDDRLKLDYIYKGTADARSNMGKFSKGFDDIDNKELVTFYEKVYKLQFNTEVMRDDLKEHGKWRDYTYIRKHLLPNMTKYCKAVEGILLGRNPGYSAALGQRQQVLRKEVFQRIARIKQRDKLVRRNNKLKIRK